MLSDFLPKFTLYSEVLPVIIFCLRFKYLKQRREVVLISVLIGLSTLTDFFSISIFANRATIAVTQNVYCLVETLTLLIFFNMYIGSKIGKYTLIYVLIGFSILWFLLNMKVGFVLFESKSLAVEVALIIAGSFLFFYFQLKDPKTLYIYKTHRFWFITAFLINLTGILFFFLYRPSLSQSEAETYRILNFFFLILRTILLSIGMTITEEEDESLPSNNLLA
jgi:hypothetical protein